MRQLSIFALVLSSCLVSPLVAQLPDSPTGRVGNKIIVLSNLDPPSASEVSRHLRGLIESVVD